MKLIGYGAHSFAQCSRCTAADGYTNSAYSIEAYVRAILTGVLLTHSRIRVVTALEHGVARCDGGIASVHDLLRELSQPENVAMCAHVLCRLPGRIPEDV